METENNVEIKPLPPVVESLVRGLFASVPYVGALLDHLVFDRATAMAQKNIESCINELSDRLAKIEEAKIDKNWFASDEAIAAIKVLFDKVAYETNSDKVKVMGETTAVLGLQENKQDKHKVQSLEYIGDLAYTQINLLKMLKSMPYVQYEGTSGGLKTRATGLWTNDIARKLQQENNQFIGTFMQDMEILEARNAIRRMPLAAMIDAGGHCYTMTEIGKIAAKYITQAER